MRRAVRRNPRRPQRVGSTRPRHEFTSPSSPTSCCGAGHIRRDQTSRLYFCAVTLVGWRPVWKDEPTMSKNQTQVRFQSSTSVSFFSLASTLNPRNAASTWEMCGYGSVRLSIRAWKTRIIRHEAEDYTASLHGQRGCVYLQCGNCVCLCVSVREREPESADADPSAQSASANLMTVTFIQPSQKSRSRTRAFVFSLTLIGQKQEIHRGQTVPSSFRHSCFPNGRYEGELADYVLRLFPSGVWPCSCACVQTCLCSLNQN